MGKLSREPAVHVLLDTWLPLRFLVLPRDFIQLTEPKNVMILMHQSIHDMSSEHQIPRDSNVCESEQVDRL